MINKIEESYSWTLKESEQKKFKSLSYRNFEAVFEVVAMPFPCNDLMLCCFNIPFNTSVEMVHWYAIRFVRCRPGFESERSHKKKESLIFEYGWLGMKKYAGSYIFCLLKSSLYDPIWVAIWYIKRRRGKRKLAITDFLYKLSHL